MWRKRWGRVSRVLTETEEDRRDIGRRMWRKGWGRVSRVLTETEED